MKLRFKKILAVMVALAMTVSMLSLQVFATTITVVDGAVSIADTAGSNTKNSETSATIKAKGSLVSKKTNTITITNASGSKANLSFHFEVSSYNSFTIAGTASAASGDYSVMLDPAGTLVLALQSKSGLSGTTATLTLSNISLAVAAASSNVTVAFDSALGSVTAGGEAVSDGAVMEGVTPDVGVVLAATANSGATFLGWVNAETRAILSTAASFTLQPAADMTAEAVFATTEPYFLANNGIYADLNAAATAAASATTKTVVLMNSATLPAGDYTIPAGVTLLIPCDAANTVYTTKPGLYTESTHVKPTAYRTLTMAEGVVLTVQGSLSVAGWQSGKIGKNGCVSGPVGFIKMNAGSSISVESGANLYAWGYVTGSGSVEAKSGATVYEGFQLTDFRGGDMTSQMADTSKNKYGVFPMSQYYLQNIEVPLTLHVGAKEYAHMAAWITLIKTQAITVPVVDGSGGSAMFQIGSGYIVKDYIEGTGRTEFTTNGDFSVAPVSMSMKLGVLGSTTINSEDFNLPIPSHMTVRAVGGTVNIKQDIALLPGAELYIGEGVSGTFGAGNRAFVYDLDDWGNYCFQSGGQQPYVKLPYVPGGDGIVGRDKDALVEVNGTIDASAGAVYSTAGGANIYSTGSGAVITAAGTETETHQFDQSSETYPSIPIVPAVLKNGDGSNYATVKVTTATEIRYENQVWDIDCEHADGSPVAEYVIEASCTVGGSYESVTYCTICGGQTSRQTVVTDPTGHTEVVDAAVAATCTATGLTEGKHCSVCNEVIVAQTVVDALGHTEVIDAAVAPTCTATGLTEGKHCSVCGEVTVAQTVVDAKGHTAGETVVENKTAGDCTNAGSYDNVVYCADCGTEMSRETVTVDALGHTEVVDAAVAATCTATGLTEGKHCSVCGEVTVAQTVVDALGHTEVVDAAVAPTCTATGLTEGKHCSVCNEVLVAQTVVDALGHTEVVDAAVAPTCTATGLTEGKHCSVCNEVIVAQTVVDALGHTEVVDAAVAPTCTATGLTEGKHCSVCNEVIVAQTVVDAKGHTAGETVVENEVAGDCTTDGSYNNVVYCADCGTELSRETVSVAAAGHTEVIDAAVAATCTTTGLTEGKHCSVCNEVIVAQTEVDALGHDYQGVVTEPTDTDDGYTTYTCSRCGDSYVADRVPATGTTTDGISLVVKTEGESTYATVEVSDEEAARVVEGLSGTNGDLALDLESVEQETLVLPGNLVEALAGSDAASSVTVTTEHSVISMSDSVLNTVAAAMDEEESVSLKMVAKEIADLSAEQQGALEGKSDLQVAILEVTLLVNDAQGNVKQEITELGGEVEVTIQCSPEMQGKDVVACYISPEGEITELDCVYDAEANTLSFTTNHFSTYAAVVRSSGSTGGTTTDGTTRLLGRFTLEVVNTIMVDGEPVDICRWIWTPLVK